MTIPTSYAPNQRIYHRLNQVLSALVAPHTSVSGTERQQAQLLLSLLVAIFPWVLGLGLLDMLFLKIPITFGYVFFDISLPIIVAIAYLIGRTEHFKIGAWLTVIAPALVISILIFILNPSDVGVFALYYLVFSPLLASLLLNVRATFFVALVNLVIIVAGIYYVPHWHFVNLIDEVLYNVLVPIFLIVSALVRQQYVAQLQQAEQVARSARDEAEQSNKVKSAFLASMSHELRTPLNGILNFTEFLAMEVLGKVNDAQQDALNKIHTSGKHLLELINDILDIAKIEAGKLQLFLEHEVNLNTELETVISTQILLKDKPVQFITDIDTDLPLVTCDRRRIKQVVINLLSNAAKFTQQGSITLGVKSRPDHILFMVSDTGVGISAEDQIGIFEPFKQSDTGLKYGGTGLGLPITKSIIEAHGGKLWVESEKGDGATFFATLPLQAELDSDAG